MASLDHAEPLDLLSRVRATRLPTPRERRRIRQSAGATLRDIAEALQVTPMTVLRWERDDARPNHVNARAYRRLLDDLAEAVR